MANFSGDVGASRVLVRLKVNTYSSETHIMYMCLKIFSGAREDENFGTSGSKKSRFVSEIQLFKVGIAVRPNFTM